jgi:hypothetical protein
MDRPGDPPHDRVRLTNDERAALASFERSLGEEDARGGPGRRVRSRVVDTGRTIGRVAPRFVRLSPWLALLGFLALPLAVAASDAAGWACALFVTGALTTWLVTPRGRWARWLAKQTARAEEAERRRAKGHP